MAQREKVFLGRDNAIKLGLIVDGTPISASTITRMIARLTDSAGNVTNIDSNTSGNEAVFDVSDVAQVSDTAIAILTIKLQDAVTPPPVGNDYQMDLILYDVVNTDGVRWNDPFPLEVIAA